MTQAQLTKAWSINPNVRNAYTSLADMAGWWIFQNHSFLITKNWTVKFTSNGTTGPTNSADTTNRIISNATAGVRGASAASAQSWSVLQNPDGLQILFAFQGATDNVIRVGYSPGGLYTLAGTTTFQPTATDEVVITVGSDVVNATTSLDRVMSIWAADDGTAWSNTLFRNSALNQTLGVEKVIPRTATGVYTVPYVGYRYNSYVRTNAPGGNSACADPHNVAVGTTGWFGTAARVLVGGSFRITRLGAGSWLNNGSVGTGRTTLEVFLGNTTAMQAAMPILPILWSGELSVGFDGILGSAFDWWVAYSSSQSTVPAFGDFMPGYEPADVPGVSGGQDGLGAPRTNWLIAFGPAMVRPWRNAAASFQIA